MDNTTHQFLKNFIKYANDKSPEWKMNEKLAFDFLEEKYKILNPHLVFKDDRKHTDLVKCTCTDEKCVTGIKHYEDNNIMLIDKHNNENLMYVTKKSAKQIIQILKQIK